MNTRSGISVIWQNQGGSTMPSDRLKFAKAPSWIWVILLTLACLASDVLLFPYIRVWLNISKANISRILDGRWDVNTLAASEELWAAKLYPPAIWIGVMLFAMLWVVRTRVSLQRSRVSGLGTPPGEAAGMWLFPPFKAFACYRLVLQSYRASAPSMGYANRDWQKNAVPVLFKIWYWLSILGYVILLPSAILFYLFLVDRLLSPMAGGVALGWIVTFISWLLLPVVAIIIQLRLAGRYSAQQNPETPKPAPPAAPPAPAAPVNPLVPTPVPPPFPTAVPNGPELDDEVDMLEIPDLSEFDDPHDPDGDDEKSEERK